MNLPGTFGARRMFGDSIWTALADINVFECSSIGVILSFACATIWSNGVYGSLVIDFFIFSREKF